MEALMNEDERLSAQDGVSPFERIRRTNASGAEYWSSRDFAQVLGYSDYRNFEQVAKKAKTACFNSAHSVEDHFGDITEMVAIMFWVWRYRIAVKAQTDGAERHHSDNQQWENRL
jgi:hypothetical protein